ncbi:MAG: c-type cytochrome domain-containing protein [Pirellulales bacterium]
MRSQFLIRKQLYRIALAGIVALGSISAASAAVTPEQKQQIEKLQQEAKSAGQLYTAGKFEESAKKVTEIQDSLEKLLKAKDPNLQKQARPIYNSLERAHALLELEGADLKPLPAWDKIIAGDMPAADAKKGDGVSFKTDIAPWLISQCGNCHINNQRGRFSLATFDDLLKGSAGGKVIFPGGSKGSRLVEVIESGDMPRGGGKVSDENFAKLKKWIDDGAKFDGPDQAAPLASYAKASGDAAPKDEPMTPKAPTGKETVSFAKDIAPILTENCNGCHINGRRPSGNFSMQNFTNMIRGGDSGKPILPGKVDESLLIKKLKGQSGQRMPAGRPPLSDEKMKLISTWISEGAVFDGAAPNLGIESVINQAWAASASHEELLAKRVERAKGLWKKVLPNVDPLVASNDQLIVLGDVTPDRAQEWLKAADEAAVKVRELLRIPAEEKLVKGGVTIFVYKSRYDYAEYGRMNESRTLPNYWMAHWRATPLDVYIALVDDTKLDAKQQTGVLIQQLSGAHVGSLPQVPEWFAEGVARNVAVATADRKDPRLDQWKQSMPAAAALVDKSETLLDGKLDDEASGLVGMKLTSVMMDRKNRKRFDTMLEQMRHGKPFTEACTASFAPPAQFVKSWIGK